MLKPPFVPATSADCTLHRLFGEPMQKAPKVIEPHGNALQTVTD